MTIIDGTYTLEHGPIGGPAHRKDIVIAIRDILEADFVGAKILGKNPIYIPHIKEYAMLTKRHSNLDDIVVKGEKIEEVSDDLPYKMNFDQCFIKAGVKGIRVLPSEGDVSICSGCYRNMEIAHKEFVKYSSGSFLGGIEIYIGSDSKGKHSSNKVFLFGNCAINKNKGMKNAIKIQGCPPGVYDYLPVLKGNTLNKSKIRKIRIKKMIKLISNKLGLYEEKSDRYDPYKSVKFKLDHFR